MLNRTLTTAVSVLAVMLMAAPLALADEGESDRSQRRRPLEGPRFERDGKERGDRAKRGGPRDRHRTLFDGIDLSDEQKAEIKEIMKAAGEARKAYIEANRDAFAKVREQMNEARESKDREAMKAAHDAFKALMQDGPKPPFDKAKAVLTDEQLKQFEANLEKAKAGRHNGHGKDRGHAVGRVLHSLNLTEDQKTKIKQIFADARDSVDQEAAVEIREEMKTARENKDREAMKAAMDKLKALRESSDVDVIGDIKKVLTDEQVEKLEAALSKRKEHRGKRGGDGERPMRDRDGGKRRGGGDDKLDL